MLICRKLKYILIIHIDSLDLHYSPRSDYLIIYYNSTLIIHMAS